MLSLFKSDPIKKLEKQYYAKLKEAMETQRNGDMRRYAELTEEANKMLSSIEELKMQRQVS